MRHCCVDVETLSVPENCYNPFVLSLGAIAFDDDDASFRRYFYRRLSTNQKGKWDNHTRAFWESLSPPVRKLAGYPTKEKVNFGFGDIQNERFDIKWAKMDPADVLTEFRAWDIANKSNAWWGNSPSFDMAVINHLHESIDFPTPSAMGNALPPWKVEKTKSKFWLERDVRTVKDIFEQFKLSANDFQFYENCKKDWEAVGIGRIFNVKHFALFDATEEASIVYTTRAFLSKCKAVIEG